MSQGQLKDLNALYEDEQKLREEQHQATTKAEKKANDLNLEMEEIKAQLEQVRVDIKLYFKQHARLKLAGLLCF